MGYRVVVVGATGNVGREMLNILAERQFPLDEIAAVASPRSTGDLIDFGDSGKELRVRMSPDGHFWVVASINGVERRMLIDSGATVTAISEQTAREAKIDTGAGLAPVVLRTANGAAPAETGKVDELRVGNIVARDLRIVTSPGLGGLDVIGMNFLSKLQSWRVEGRTLILVPHHPQNATS